MSSETASTSPYKSLSPAELAVCANVGGRLARGEIAPVTALTWLQGWVRTPVAVDPKEGGDR